MSGDKTQKPTAKKLADARNKGSIAKSADLTSSAVTLSILAVMGCYGSVTTGYLMRLMKGTFAHPPQIHTIEALSSLLSTMIMQLGVIVAPFLLVPLVAGIAVNLAQVKPLLTLEPLKPSFQKVNPLDGFKRLVSRRSLVQLIKNVLKMFLVTGIVFSIGSSQLNQILGIGSMGVASGLGRVFDIIISMGFNTTLFLLVLGGIDWFYQKYELTKSLMMTRQEIKDEMRNAEGNAEMKAKIKNKGRSFATKRMLAAVPLADVIVTNPTHYSVALQYDPDLSPAPRVVAKGTDHMAFKIREIAKEHKIPIHENVPLARSLHAAVEVNHVIPVELFMAVAEVLAVVYQKTGGRKKRQPKTNHSLLLTQ